MLKIMPAYSTQAYLWSLLVIQGRQDMYILSRGQGSSNQLLYLMLYRHGYDHTPESDCIVTLTQEKLPA